MKPKEVHDYSVKGIGLVRECLGCGALITHGPTRCVRCAEMGDPKPAWWKKYRFRLWAKYKSWRSRYKHWKKHR